MGNPHFSAYISHRLQDGERKSMKNEFTLAFNEVLEEKQLPQEVILEALEAAMVSAYRRAVNASNAQQVEASIDPETGKVLIYAEKEVVETVEDARTEVSLREAQKVDPNAQIGSMVVVETTPLDFGRVAAQTARQVIQQRIREAEREAQQRHFSKHQGEIVSGIVQAVNPSQITIGLDMKAEGIMARQHQIPGERFRVHDRVRALLLEAKTTNRGPQITLSRAHRNFLRRLLENEVPEIYQGMVEIRSIAREPGQRSKVAVAALQSGVDPVGACVGIKGVRIQAIVRELNDEKIDVIEWNADPAAYIAKALSPARVSGVYLDEHTKGAKTATVVVPEDQLSLAIGRDGQNARLAAKLTSWRIDIKSLPEAAADALNKLKTDPAFAVLAENEKESLPQVEVILGKKAEGRPITPEEYTVLTQLVDRVERGIIQKYQADKRGEDEREQQARALVPAGAFEIPLEKFEVSDRVYTVISEAGFPTVGELMYQMIIDPDSVLKLSGMGPKGMKELEEALDKVRAELETQEVAELAAQEAPLTGEQEPTEAVVEPEMGFEPALATEEVGALQAEAEEALPQPTVAEPEAEPALVEEGLAQMAVTESGVETSEIEEQPQETIPEPEPVAVMAPEPSDLEDLFSFDENIIADIEEMEDEDVEEEGKDKKGKKRKKKKSVQLEYDPDQDVMIAKRKRKRGGGWDDDWNF